jgi:hypothetical protein
MANSRARFCLTDASTDYRVLLIEPGMHLLKKKRLHFRQGLAWYHLGYGYSPYEFDGKTMINKDGRDSCHAEKSI